jgi:hypothetical protein
MALDAVLALVVQPAKVAGLGCTAKPIQVPPPGLRMIPARSCRAECNALQR